MSNKNGKIWGVTEKIVANNVLEFHRIHIKKDGYCSKHKHNHKINAFYVQEGKLLIRVWKNNYDLVDETVLESGDFMEVADREFHQFYALEDTVAFELYWARTLNHDDIERETVGGNKEK